MGHNSGISSTCHVIVGYRHKPTCLQIPFCQDNFAFSAALYTVEAKHQVATITGPDLTADCRHLSTHMHGPAVVRTGAVQCSPGVVVMDATDGVGYGPIRGAQAGVDFVRVGDRTLVFQRGQSQVSTNITLVDKLVVCFVSACFIRAIDLRICAPAAERGAADCDLQGEPAPQVSRGHIYRPGLPI
jgi:hypothetical protein